MTKRVTLQPGDLVRYNVSKRKNTSLAHVVEVRHPTPHASSLVDRLGSIFVLWIKVGEYNPKSWDYPVKSGQVVKHPYSPAWKKVSE